VVGTRGLSAVPEFAAFDPAPRREPPYSGLVVRDACAADLDAVAALAAAREGVDDPSRFRDTFAHALGAADQELLVAEVGGRIAGYGRSARLALPGLPEGWYLTGLVVATDCRRRGAGLALTHTRLERGLARAPRVLYFATAVNTVTIALHERLGFREVARGIVAPGTSFTGGVGVLFECTRDDAQRAGR